MSRHRRQLHRRARRAARVRELERRAFEVVRGAVRPKGWILLSLSQSRETHSGDLLCVIRYIPRTGGIGVRPWRVSRYWLRLPAESYA